jgi:hypothetical protein
MLSEINKIAHNSQCAKSNTRNRAISEKYEYEKTVQGR